MVGRETNIQTFDQCQELEKTEKNIRPYLCVDGSTVLKKGLDNLFETPLTAKVERTGLKTNK